MKRIYNILAMAFMAAIVLVGCSKEDPFMPDVNPGKGEGQVSLKKMLVEIDNKEAVVRSSVDISTFIVTVSNASEIVAEFTYQTLPEVLTLPVGDYTVNVKSHEVKNTAWDEPYFVGSQSFSIEENKITEVETIVCKLSNVKVSVKYDNKLLNEMGDDCNVNVKVGQLGDLNFSKTETRSGYFKYDAGSTTMVATFTGTVQGVKEENFRTYVDVAPGKHYIITYKLHFPGGHVPDVAGDITTGVNVDSYVTIENLTINVDEEEEILPDDKRPEEEEPETPDNPNEPGDDPEPPVVEGPTVEAVDPITFDAPNVVTAASTVQIKVHSDHEDGFTEFKVIINSAVLTPDELEAVGLTDVLDLVNPGDFKDSLSNLGLPVEDQVAGQKDLLLDISQFMGLLGMLGSGSHDFQLTVADANGTTTKTLTIVIQ